MWCPDSIWGLKYAFLQLLGVLATGRFQWSPSLEVSLTEEYTLPEVTSPPPEKPAPTDWLGARIIKSRCLVQRWGQYEKLFQLWYSHRTGRGTCISVQLHLSSTHPSAQLSFPHPSPVLFPRALFNKCPLWTSQSLFSREPFL